MNCLYCNHPIANHPDEKRTYCTDCWKAGLQDENDLHCTHKRYNLELAAWKSEAEALQQRLSDIRKAWAEMPAGIRESLMQYHPEILKQWEQLL